MVTSMFFWTLFPPRSKSPRSSVRYRSLRMSPGSTKPHTQRKLNKTFQVNLTHDDISKSEYVSFITRECCNKDYRMCKGRTCPQAQRHIKSWISNTEDRWPELTCVWIHLSFPAWTYGGVTLQHKDGRKDSLHHCREASGAWCVNEVWNPFNMFYNTTLSPDCFRGHFQGHR